MKKFTDWEESILFQCMNDKICPDHNKALSALIEKNLTQIPYELWRGITNTELDKIADLGIGDTFCLNRVTSFSESQKTAIDFSSSWSYNSGTMIKIESGYAYRYWIDMLNILRDTPIEEFIVDTLNDSHGTYEERIADAESRKEDKIEMIEYETEWMVPDNHRFVIVNIEDVWINQGVFTQSRVIYTVRMI